MVREGIPQTGSSRAESSVTHGTIAVGFPNWEYVLICSTVKLVTLQVRGQSGEFISAPTIPGAVLINVADLMQRWTSDQYVSVVSGEGLFADLY